MCFGGGECDCYNRGYEEAEEEFQVSNTDHTINEALKGSPRLVEAIWRLQVTNDCWCGAGTSRERHTDTCIEFRIYFQQNPYKGA